MKDNSSVYSAAESLLKNQEYYGAAIKYGTLYHLSVFQKNGNINLESINASRIFAMPQIEDIQKEYENEIKHCEHILSIGKYWNDDEFLLIYSNLIDCHLLMDYFKHFNIQLDQSFRGVYSLLADASKISRNDKNMGIAKRTIKKNAKEFSIKWLDEVLK